MENAGETRWQNINRRLPTPGCGLGRSLEVEKSSLGADHMPHCPEKSGNMRPSHPGGDQKMPLRGGPFARPPAKVCESMNRAAIIQHRNA